MRKKYIAEYSKLVVCYCTSPSMALTSKFRSYCSVFSREVSL